MGLSRGKKLRKEDFLGQAKFVEKYVELLSAKRVLELGVGRGANSVYLAKNHPDVIFEGIDLADGQLDYAIKAAKGVKNFRPREGDFHNLRNYAPGSFDVVFVVEALCHSNKKETVAKEATRVLKRGGLFIVIDAYSSRQGKRLTKNEKLVKNLIEKGMRVAGFEYFYSFKKQVSRAGFKLVLEKDASESTMPTLLKLERLSASFFSLPGRLKRIVVGLFPKEFTYNIISGYLMAETIRSGIARYEMLVFEKR